MRMWYVNPKVLCNQHLLGEHCEMHMFAGSILAKIKLHGYVTGNLLAGQFLQQRHDLLATELIRRGGNHKSPLQVVAVPEVYSVEPDVYSSVVHLLSHCTDCRLNAEPFAFWLCENRLAWQDTWIQEIAYENAQFFQTKTS